MNRPALKRSICFAIGIIAGQYIRLAGYVWLAISPSLRPYGSVAIGPWLRSATNSHVGTNVESKTVSESVLGLRVQAGVDMFFAKRFKAGIVLGYDLVSDFDEQIGSHRNYSGLLFSAGLGILLGAGR